MKNDFISYWTLELLNRLCRCPFEPRKPQIEFVNKHTLLNDKMLTCLIDLMTSRLDMDKSIPGVGMEEQENTSNEKQNNSSGNSLLDPTGPPQAPITHVSAVQDGAGAKVTPNLAPTAHLPSAAPQKAGIAHTTHTGSAKGKESGPETPGSFYPNSLVIVSSASLLESVVTSSRDTSSPELLNTVLGTILSLSLSFFHSLSLSLMYVVISRWCITASY